MSSYFFEVNVFKDCEFFNMIEEANLRSLICDAPMEIHPYFVKIFHANLKYANGISTFEVKKHHISLSLEEFAENCSLPCFSLPYSEIDQGDGFISFAYFYFLHDQNYGINSPFLMGGVLRDIHLIHYVVSRIIVHRKHNLRQLSKSHMVMNWSFSNKVETKSAITMIHHMIVSKRKGVMWLPYSHLVLRFLEHVGFNFEDEEFKDKLFVIGNADVGIMRIAINNKVPSQKPYRARRSTYGRQAQ